jgi:hypothetical protein
LTFSAGFEDNPRALTALRLLSIGLPLTAAIVDLIAVVVVLAGARDRRLANSFALMALCLAFPEQPRPHGQEPQRQAASVGPLTKQSA